MKRILILLPLFIAMVDLRADDPGAVSPPARRRHKTQPANTPAVNPSAPGRDQFTVEHDAAGTFVSIRQIGTYLSAESDPAAAAAEYLRQRADTLGIDPAQIHFRSRPETNQLDNTGPEFRLNEIYPDAADGAGLRVECVLTCFGLTVTGGYAEVQLRKTATGLEVQGASLRFIPHLQVRRPVAAGLERLRKLKETELAAVLGLDRSKDYDAGSMKILGRELAVAHYDAGQRVFMASVELVAVNRPIPMLPASDSRLEDGGYYVAGKIRFTIHQRGANRQRFAGVAFIDSETRSALRLELTPIAHE